LSKDFQKLFTTVKVEKYTTLNPYSPTLVLSTYIHMDGI
jgi:hypothetical protein